MRKKQPVAVSTRRKKPVVAEASTEAPAKRIAACSKCGHVWTPKGYKLGRCPVCQDDLSAHYISGGDKEAIAA